MLGRNLGQKEYLWRIMRFAMILSGISLAGLAVDAVISLAGKESPSPAAAEIGKQKEIGDTSRDRLQPLGPAASGEPSDDDAAVAQKLREVPDVQFRSLMVTEGHQTASADSVERGNLPIDLAEVDQVILSGRYSLATELLDEYEPHASELLRSQIRLRQALCAELAGDLPKALKHYRLLTAADESAAVADVATLSAARVLITLGHTDTGNMMLMRLLLRRERLMSSGTRGDVVHALASGLVPVTDDSDLLADSTWVTEKQSQTPEALLESWSEIATVHPLPGMHDVLELRELAPSPEGIFVTLRSPPTTPVGLLVQMCIQLKWSARMSPEVEAALRTRIVEADCAELPLDVLLDLILTTHGCEWSFGDNVLTITAAETGNLRSPDADIARKAEMRQLVAAERFLHLATELAPEHAAAPLSYVLLGSTAAKLGDVDRASRLFSSSFDQFPRSPFAGSAMFNLAKAMLSQGKRDDALIRFYHTVDNATSLKLDCLSSLYIGRIMMENDQPRQAILPLLRGLELSEGTPYERQAALLLSAAHLLSGDAASSNSVLFEHRKAFEFAATDSPSEKDRARELTHQAAFLSSLARFWGTTGTKRIREGRELLSALTTVHPERMFGGHSVYLVGIGFGAVGLTSEQEALFRRCLGSQPAFSLQKRMVSLLNGDLSPEDSLKVSDSIPSGFADQSADADEMSRAAVSRVELLKAETAYRSGDYEKVRVTSLNFLAEAAKHEAASANTPPDARETQVRRSMLRLLGLVYQAEGRHEEAVRCFAGAAPDPLTAPEDYSSEDSDATGKPTRETL